MENPYEDGRNPFFYSGHFNFAPSPFWRIIKRLVAIPSFIQGISTDKVIYSIYPIYMKSQSLLLFRAFQPNCPPMGTVGSLSQVAIPSFIQGISTYMKIFKEVLS